MQGEAKKKRKRSRADKGEMPGPKRPAGAYLLFLQDFRHGYLQARPDVTVTAREIASAAGAAWRTLVPQLKRQYEAQGAAEKAKYASAKKEHAAAVPAERTASQPSGGSQGHFAVPKPADARHGVAAVSGGQRQQKRAAVDGEAEAEEAEAEEAEEKAEDYVQQNEEKHAAPGMTPVHAGKDGPAAITAAAVPASAVLQMRAVAGAGSSPARAPGLQQAPTPPPTQLPALRSGASLGAGAAVAAGLEDAMSARGTAGQAPQLAEQTVVQIGGPSGFSLFVQEARAAYELMFCCGPAPLPEAVLAAAQAWWTLPSFQRLDFASRQAQMQASNPALGMHTLVPDLEQKMVNMAAAAASAGAAAGPAAAAAAGGQAEAPPAQLLEQLLASDVGPPPVLPSLAAAPLAVQQVAEVAAQMAWVNAMRSSPPEGQVVMLATAQVVVDAAAHAVAGTHGAEAALEAGAGLPLQAGPAAGLPATCTDCTEQGGHSAALLPSAIGSPCSSAMDSVLGLLPFT
ncbi:hypothetical protein ABPG75_003895 [Micractinium tetrahymenae]